MKPKKSRRPTHDDRYEAAVRSAAKLFLQNGIEEISMAQIADDSGVGVASLYRWFGTKTQLAISAGTILWGELRSMFDGVFESPVYLAKDGLHQTEDLMKLFCVLYEAHSNFLKFVQEFDMLMIHEKVTPSALVDYEKSVLNVYPLFEKACRKGVADGSIRADVNSYMTYVSLAHALLSMCEKFILGDIMPSDTKTDKSAQLYAIIDMALCYLRA